MASLAATAVTVNRAYYEGGLQGKDYVKKNVTVVLVAQGSNTNPLPAAAFGFAKITEGGVFVKAANGEFVMASPSVDGSTLIFAAYDSENAINIPADYTGTYTGTITGVPAT